MGSVDADGLGQRAARPLEAGFQNVVGIFACKLYKVDCAGQVAHKAQPELLHALHVKIAYFFGLAVDIPVEGAAAGDIHRAEDEGFVHGQSEAAVAADAPHIAQSLGKSLPQRNADILGGVVVVHLHIAVAGEDEVKAAMPGKQLQHVVQKAAARVHLIAARAVQIEGQLDLRLVGVPFDAHFPHGSFLQNLVKSCQQRLHFLRRANGDAQPVGNARGIEMPHQHALFFQLFVKFRPVFPLRAGKQEIGAAVQAGEAPRFQLLFRPGTGLDDGRAGLVEIGGIVQRGLTGFQGQPVDIVGVQAELDPIQVCNELCIAHGQAQPGTRQLAGFGERLDHQQVLVLVDEGHAALPAKVHIGLVHNDHVVGVGFQDALYGTAGQGQTRGGIGVGNDDGLVSAVVIGGVQREILFQGNEIAGDVEQPAPDAVAAVGDVGIGARDIIGSTKKNYDN